MGSFPILSAIVWLPVIGALAILAFAAFNKGNPQRAAGFARIQALIITVLTLVLAIRMVLDFDTTNTAMQFNESIPWYGMVHYALGVDGISYLFVLLTAFLMPLCIIASWKSIDKRVVEYFAAFLLLESTMMGVFCATDLVLFYVYFEAGLIPMYLIIGIWGGKNRVYAAYKFFLYTLLGSLFMLVAVAYMAVVAKTTFIPDLHKFAFDPQVQTILWLAFFCIVCS